MMTIEKLTASIARLHGGPREQRAKYVSFIAWQLRERAQASGLEPSSILKKFDDVA